MRTVAEIIDALGGVTKVSKFLKKSIGTVSAWKTRGSIPDEYRPGIVTMASDLGVPGISYETLTLLHAQKPLDPRGPRAEPA